MLYLRCLIKITVIVFLLCLRYIADFGKGQIRIDKNPIPRQGLGGSGKSSVLHIAGLVTSTAALQLCVDW